MESQKHNSKLLFAGILSALAASLCCITPLLALVAGVSGAASTFSWLDPFRPWLIGLTLIVLGFAWYLKLRPKKEAINCNCDEGEVAKKPFIQSNSFLAVVTLVVTILLSFPYYSHLLVPRPANASVETTIPMVHQVKLDIKGMTCQGCESTVNHVLSNKKGVISTVASYDKGQAEVSYDPAVVSPETLRSAIEEEIGYQVTDMKIIELNK